MIFLYAIAVFAVLSFAWIAWEVKKSADECEKAALKEDKETKK